MCDTTTSLPLTPQEMEDARAYHRQREALRAAEREAERLAWLARVRAAVAEVASQHNAVQRVCLYGSLVQERRFRADSDIDVAIECADLATESAFWHDLERHLQREVDVRPLAGSILSEVQRYGIIVYEREGAVMNKEELLRLYHGMVLIRRTEEQLAKSYAAGLIHGACHTYVGEEAVATGVCAHLRPDDAVFSTHRGHGHALAKGVPPRQVIAELYGRATGCSRGRGGSMHLFSPEVGMMGTSGIVGPCILQASGAGYSFKLLKTDRVAVAFFGDGAVNNGAFHEGINLAAIWKLPVLFVCENNLYATEVPFAAASANPDVGNRGPAYGLPSVIVDGNDVLAVYAAAGDAVQRARRGDGPTLIECKTYRTRAHSEGMREGGYRSQAEIDAWKARDPIVTYHARLLADGLAPEEDLDEIDADVRSVVEDAADFAASSPWPDPASAAVHVYREVQHA